MPNLRPEAAALMRTGRSALQPGAGDRDRILEALRSRLGDGILVDAPSGGGTGSAGVALRSGLHRWLLVGIGVPFIGLGAAWVLSRPHATPASLNATTQAVLAAPVETPPIENAVSPEVDQGPPAGIAVGRVASAPRPGPTRPTTRTASDSLLEEVSLLGKATQELNGGRPDDALKTLAEHERRFPAGSLAEERVATRVEALCALGRGTEAKGEVAKLIRIRPRSSYLEHARTVCGWDPGATP
jgi:hypothetical protein